LAVRANITSTMLNITTIAAEIDHPSRLPHMPCKITRGFGGGRGVIARARFIGLLKPARNRKRQPSAAVEPIGGARYAHRPPLDV
jgi:hypothetical protein